MADAVTFVEPQFHTFDILHGAPRWRVISPADTATAPHAAIASVRLHIVTPRGNVAFFMGTAWFVRSDVVVTSAHVTDVAHAWAQVSDAQRWHLEVVPAMSGAARPFGTFWAASLRRHPRWTWQHTTPFDIATINVAPATGGAPFPAAQCLVPRADAITAASMPAVQVSGYPQVVGAGTTQVAASGAVRVVESSLCFYDMDTEDGHSGAPVMRSGATPAEVVAIHSGGRRIGISAAARVLNAGLILRRELVDWIQQA